MNQQGLTRLNKLPAEPTNVIFTGVAGTGKTYQLLQLQRLYDQSLETAEPMLWQTLLAQVSWREVICAILLMEEQALRVAQITAHPLFQQKALANGRRDNLAQTAWGVLLPYSKADSTTVNFSGDNRASIGYFDQTSDKAWYLLDDVKSELAKTSPINELLALYRQQSFNNQILSEAHEHSRKPPQPQAPPFSTVSRSCLVSFHQAYGYEEFVEGIRPSVGAQGQISYQIQAGAFLRLCQKAAQDPEHRYAMLIDEINRANVSRVFGELMSLIEPDKRAGQANAMQVSLAYSGRAFSVPSNVDIYATMNTQDQSLAPLDMAFRRRFQFIDCPPRPELLSVIEPEQSETNVNGSTEPDSNPNGEHEADEAIELARILYGINRRICQVLGQDSQLGHAFLMGVNTLSDLQAVLVHQLIPQLAQASGAQLEMLHYLLNDADQPIERQFIHNQPTASPASGLTQSTSYRPTVQGFESSHSQHSAIGVPSNYWLNPDLLALTGAFAHASVYRQLY